MMKFANAVNMVHNVLLPRIYTAGCMVDATAGNGRDTAFLAANSPDDALIWAFDIQKEALEKTRTCLQEQGQEKKVRLILDSHANLPLYVRQPIDVAMFNLGYLPGGAHQNTTQADSTLQALEAVLTQLKAGGLISIVAYPGHAAGKLEHEAVRRYLSVLPSPIFAVGSWSMINQAHEPPVMFLVEKVRSEFRERPAPC
ncbi:tRNA (mnm(5)s(2)U34)-methyltransferase [Lucifera butyrica]|nr:class I SAM-dependent methyltransferase [Lucifera butyrica]